MVKTKHKKVISQAFGNRRFSETWLVIFAVVFATVGSYTWMRSYAAPEDTGLLIQSQVSAEEQALFSSVTSASALILATGPIAALLFWWIWRRSSFGLWSKLLLSIFPVLIVMAFT